MNCKPGDLAINVGGLPECRDEIYLVVRRYDGHSLFRDLGPAWWVDHRGVKYHCDDCCLRPIRDPGEDAKDNAWDWLPPVPKQREKHRDYLVSLSGSDLQAREVG